MLASGFVNIFILHLPATDSHLQAVFSETADAYLWEAYSFALLTDFS